MVPWRSEHSFVHSASPSSLPTDSCHLKTCVVSGKDTPSASRGKPLPRILSARQLLFVLLSLRFPTAKGCLKYLTMVSPSTDQGEFIARGDQRGKKIPVSSEEIRNHDLQNPGPTSNPEIT